MENDLVERLRQEAIDHAGEARTANSTIYEIYQVISGATGEPGNWHGAEPVRAYVAAKEARIQALETELAAALIEVSNQARLRGEAEGKLHVSELAGIVEGWQLRAERAEAELARKTEALDRIADFDDPDGALDLNVLHLIRIAGAARRAARSALEEKTDV